MSHQFHLKDLLLALFLSTFTFQLQAQLSFEEVTGTENPFATLSPGMYASPAMVDIDADNDQDAFFALEDGSIAFYKNTGNATQALFELQSGDENPLNTANGIAYAGIAFADVDGDGDSDAFVSSVYAWIKYFKNTGTPQQAVFEEQSDANNPLDHYEEGFEGKLDFVDIDNDGDLDVFIGDDYGSIRFYRNDGSSTNPLFVEQTGANNPLVQVYAGDFAKPAFADLDLDGDFDLVLGVEDGNFYYFENKGTAEIASFIELTGDQNPFISFNAGTESKPAFADLDGDGDLDLIAGNESGDIRYYKNTSTTTSVFQKLPMHSPELRVINNDIFVRFSEYGSTQLNQKARISLFSLNGKSLHEFEFTLAPEVRLSLPIVPKGIYLIRFQAKNETKTIKVVL
jgi:hypothetical protein